MSGAVLVALLGKASSGTRRSARVPLGRFLGGKENSKAHGPRGFLARFAVAKKEPRNTPLWLVKCTRAAHGPEEGSQTKGGQKRELFAPKCSGENGLRCFRFGS